MDFVHARGYVMRKPTLSLQRSVLTGNNIRVEGTTHWSRLTVLCSPSHTQILAGFSQCTLSTAL